MSEALDLLVYDRTCRGRPFLPGLSHAWSAGARLYRARGWIDLARGVDSWQEALDWLCSVEPGRPIAQIQFWGHGKWGTCRVGEDELTARSLERGHPHRQLLERIRDRLAPDALWWLRTCETFGADRGQAFARAWSSFFDCRSAGHTYVIGVLQSGLHVLRPGEMPRWSPAEGLAEGTPGAPVRALWSRPDAPNTISCFEGVLPDLDDADDAVREQRGQQPQARQAR